MMQKLFRKLSQLKRGKKGFTLIEIVAVMAIIGVLSVALIPSIEAAIDRSNDTKLTVDLTNIETAGRVYKLDKGAFPVSIAVLVEGNYIPDKAYKDVQGTAIAYDAATGIASGVDSKGDTVRSNGVRVSPQEGE